MDAIAYAILILVGLAIAIVAAVVVGVAALILIPIACAALGGYLIWFGISVGGPPGGFIVLFGAAVLLGSILWIRDS